MPRAAASVDPPPPPHRGLPTSRFSRPYLCLPPPTPGWGATIQCGIPAALFSHLRPAIPPQPDSFSNLETHPAAGSVNSTPDPCLWPSPTFSHIGDRRQVQLRATQQRKGQPVPSMVALTPPSTEGSIAARGGGLQQRRPDRRPTDPIESSRLGLRARPSAPDLSARLPTAPPSTLHGCSTTCGRGAPHPLRPAC